MWTVFFSVFLAVNTRMAHAVDIIGLLDQFLDSHDHPFAKSSYMSSGYGNQEPYGQQQQQSYGYAPAPSYGYEPVSYGYDQQPSYSQQSYMQPQSYAPQSYSPPQMSYAPPQMSYAPQPQTYAPQPQSYAPQPQPYAPQPQSYAPQQTYAPQPMSYSPPQRSQGYAPRPKYRSRKTKEKVYVPVVVKKKKKKMKIISVQKGFYISGGTQLFGKYKSLKSCQKACAATPNCFAGDYNPWLYKCYIHSNFTACGVLRAHKKLIHFKKVPCSFPEAPMGRVMLGVQIFKGLEQKGIKSLSDCLKKCANAGTGVPAQVANIANQICFGIDYDFGTHRCYFHVNNNNPPNHFCPANGAAPPVPRDTVPNPSVISILLCPGP